MAVAAYSQSMRRLAVFNDRRRRLRRLRRERLTWRERVFVWTAFWATSVGPPLSVLAGVLLLLHGGPHALGIALLLLGLMGMAVPTGPLLRAWGQRRESRRKSSHE
jgi:hypothetical protein